jgi:hypothetical protein
MKVRCINNDDVIDNKNRFLLTVGNDYEVTDETPKYYYVTNDAGEKNSGYWRWRFKEVVDI